jgi:hypothetical protein
VELKEYVKRVLIDISTAVSEAQQESMTLGAIVNPKYTKATNDVVSMGLSNGGKGGTLNNIVQEIQFEILIEDIQESSAGIKGTLQVLAGGINSDESNKKINTIKFKIPICFPYEDRLP